MEPKNGRILPDSTLEVQLCICWHLDDINFD